MAGAPVILSLADIKRSTSSLNQYRDRNYAYETNERASGRARARMASSKDRDSAEGATINILHNPVAETREKERSRDV